MYSLAGKLFLVSVNGGFHWQAHQEEEVEEQRRGPNKAAAGVGSGIRRLQLVLSQVIHDLGLSKGLC